MKLPISIYAAGILTALLGPYLIMGPESEPEPSGCAGLSPIPMAAVERSEQHRVCFAYLAQHSCGGPDGTWDEIKPGVVQCLTKHNRKAGPPIILLKP